MIHVPSPIPEPLAFNDNCRERGLNWILSKQPALPDRPSDFWSPFRPDLRRGFGCRCGYYAMYLHDGQVDHFISWKTCRSNNTPELAYEWNNFRFIDGALNSSKRTLDGQLLDPFEVGDDWFEIELPSLLLRAVHVPPERAEAARVTLERLGLDQGPRVLELRWEWYDKHFKKELSLEGLQSVAPLLARAVERWTSQGHGDLPVIPRPVNDPYATLV